ncbi:IMP dehydrogenase [Kiritimatiellota bacterium B12222]|nr:IMP dehydrogenase [Kiritimatiellota bacterium B12222]
MNADIPEGLTYDDVLMVPQRSAILPANANVSSRLTKDIELNIPLVSSAMDTVTEDRLAIALAREGGLGVIHRNCTIEEQVTMIRKVKRSENIVIDNPQTIGPDIKLSKLIDIMGARGVSGFPVVDGEGHLLGIITRRDIGHPVPSEETIVSDVMTPRDRVVTGKPGFSLEDARAVLYKHRIEKLPLVDENDKLVGMMTGADIEKSTQYQSASKDARGHLRVGGAIGVGPDALNRAKALIDAGCDALFIDAATGHTETTMRVIREVKAALPGCTLVAGNVVTAEGAKDLIDAGADAIKVGVGPGSICTTRVIAGVGVPQFTAIQWVAPVCREHGIPLIADGGLRYSGDVVKALAAGADLVMVGSIVAGTDESPGALVRMQGRNYKEYRGMGSTGAMKKGSGDRYGQNSSGKLVPEGVEARIPYKGSLANVVFQLIGGVRSGMGYVGANNLTELREKAKFVRITAGGLRESHPHDIFMTEEPVNYSAS